MPDIEKYRHHLDGLDMTEQEQTEFLLALYSFTERTMDLAFGTDATQLAMKAKEDDLKKKAKGL